MSVRYNPSRKAYHADYVDALGKRRAPAFKTKREAREHEARFGVVVRKRVASVDPSITFDSMADDWLEACALRLEPQTVDGYRRNVRDHFRPVWGAQYDDAGKLTRASRALVDVTREDVRRLLVSKAAEGYKKGTIGLWLVTLSGLFSHAVERGLFEANPLRGLGKSLGVTIGNPKRQRKAGKQIKAHDREMLSKILAGVKAWSETPPYGDPAVYVAACLMAWAGLRLGETIAFQLGDQKGEHIHVNRTAVRLYGVQGYPKGKDLRIVPCSPDLARVLDRFRRERKAAGIISPWLFAEMHEPRPSIIGRYIGRIDTSIRRAAKAHGVISSSHALRHTFATSLLGANVSVAKVQAWLGHESIETTVGVYGSWLPHEDTGAIAELSRATAPA